MTESDLNYCIKLLKNVDTEIDNESSSLSLEELFDHCLKLQKLVDCSNLSSREKVLQEAIKTCIQSLEKCTLMVNDLDLFSSNETIDEVQTSSLRYLILPALLGSLTLNLQTKELLERIDNLRIAEVYFKDFLLRCKNYEISESVLKYFNEELENCTETKSSQIPNTVRQNKIQQYKLKKELDEKERNLKIALDKPESEEYVREYYCTLIERWIMTAVEEMENIKREKNVLKLAPSKENTSKKNESTKEIEPLKPIIITKNEIQKKVFGLGYPSIPVMTIEDFYYQRFHNQIKNKPSGLSLQEKALKGEESSKDAEEIEKEELLDKDDATALLKARQWDEWKDDNPRGSGNRKNKG